MKIIKDSIVDIASGVKEHISTIFEGVQKRISKFEQRVELITTLLVFWVLFDTFLKILLVFLLLKLLG